MSKTGGQIAERILDKVNDPSFTIDNALVHVNDCASFLTNKIPFSALEQYSTVLTVVGEYSVPMPDDYQRNIFFSKNITTGADITCYPDIASFRRANSDMDAVGSVSDICVQGVLVHYYRVPTSIETISMMYHRKPAQITELGYCDFTTPDNEVFVEDAFFQYGCAKLFDTIEDGIDGKSPNTDNHALKFALAKRDIELMTTQKSRSAPPISRGCFG